jgi:hypothetical protein
LSLNYGLESETIVDPIVTRTLISVAKITTVSVPAADLTLEVTAPIVSGGASAKPETIQLDLTPSAPIVLTGASVSAPPATIVLASAAPLSIGRESLLVNPPALNTAITANTPVVVSGVTVPVPTLDIDTAALAPVVDIVTPPIFNIVTYTGNGSTLNVTGVGFQPGIVWTKALSSTGAHVVHDQVRGTGKYWRPSSTAVEATNAAALTSFDQDGFTLGNYSDGNVNNRTYVAWCWPDLGTASSNTDGTITTTVAADPVKGISVFTYTGTSSAGTVGHGLGATPTLVIIKNLDRTTAGLVGSSVFPAGRYLSIATTAAFTNNSNVFAGYSSTTVSLGTQQNIQVSGERFVGYAFASVAGQSDVGTYTGLGTSSISVNVGFEPKYILLKRTSTTGDWWHVDAVRGVTKRLLHTTAAEDTITAVGFDPTGFTIASGSIMNTGGAEYTYVAFK